MRVISELELSGEPDGTEPVDLVGDFDRAPRPYRPRRPPWALATIAVAVTSAVWAASLFAAGYWHHPGPDLHGYQVTANPCGGFTLKPLTDTAGATRVTGTPADIRNGTALDQARCSVTADAPIDNGGTATFQADLTVDLHRTTDPRAEFEDQRKLEDPSLSPAETIESVPDLGDEAYLVTRSDGAQELKMLHGGAVLTLKISDYDQWTSAVPSPPTDGRLPQPPDLRQFQPALIQSARNVMAELRQPSPGSTS
jgi:hypothetical protein